MTAEKQRFVDTRQVAEMLDLHPEQIKKLRYRGEDPRWFRVGAAVRYDVLEIGSWIEEPLVVDGDVTRAEGEAEPYNIQLANIFGADACHNIDRIMRLPGTVNVPNPKKRKRGRVECLARLEHFSDMAYPFTWFTATPVVQTAEPETFAAAPQVQLSGNVDRIEDIDDLPDTVQDWCKVLIVQGWNPGQVEERSKYPSRSEAVFAVACHMVRAGCDDDLIHSVLTDPDLGISESVLESRRPEKYCARQIQRAKEEAEDPSPAPDE